VRTFLLLLSLVALVASAAGCCSIGIGSCKTTDKLTFIGSTDLNSCDDSESHAVSVRVYYLTKPHAFEEADFESLWWEEDTTFADGSKLDMHPLKVYPGSHEPHPLTRPAGATHMGVVANFCDLETARCWRKVIPLEGGLKQTITLEQTCLVVE
jgi:type VI secretion system VasD/TssJ family lipoprotein